MRTVVRGKLAAGLLVCSCASWCVGAEARTRAPAYAVLGDDIYACAGAGAEGLSWREPLVVRAREQGNGPPQTIRLPLSGATLYPLRWTMDTERVYVVVSQGDSPTQAAFTITVLPVAGFERISAGLRMESGVRKDTEQSIWDKTTGVAPLNHAVALTPVFGVGTVRYALCPADERIFLLIRIADRISLWSAVPSWAPSTRGPRLHWQRHCAFAAPFNEEFDAYAAGSRIFLVNPSGRVWCLNGSIKTIPAGPKFEDLIDVAHQDQEIRMIRIKPVGEVFGAVDPEIRAEPIEHPEVGCVILDPARDAVFFTVDGFLAAAGKTHRFPLPAGWKPPSARAAEPDVKRIGELLPVIRAARSVVPTTKPAD